MFVSFPILYPLFGFSTTDFLSALLFHFYWQSLPWFQNNSATSSQVFLNTVLFQKPSISLSENSHILQIECSAILVPHYSTLLPVIFDRFFIIVDGSDGFQWVLQIMQQPSNTYNFFSTFCSSSNNALLLGYVALNSSTSSLAVAFPFHLINCNRSLHTFLYNLLSVACAHCSLM